MLAVPAAAAAAATERCAGWLIALSHALDHGLTVVVTRRADQSRRRCRARRRRRASPHGSAPAGRMRRRLSRDPDAGARGGASSTAVGWADPASRSRRTDRVGACVGGRARVIRRPLVPVRHREGCGWAGWSPGCPRRPPAAGHVDERGGPPGCRRPHRRRLQLPSRPCCGCPWLRLRSSARGNGAGSDDPVAEAKVLHQVDAGQNGCRWTQPGTKSSTGRPRPGRTITRDEPRRCGSWQDC